jgi:hypothetical protein
LPIKYIELSKEKMWFIPVSLSVEVTAISAIHMMGKFLTWTSPYSSKFRPKHVATQIYVYNKRLSSDRRRYTVTVCNFVTRCCEKQIALLTVVSCNTNRVLLALKFVLPSWCVFIIFSVTTAALQLGTVRSLQHCPQPTALSAVYSTVRSLQHCPQSTALSPVCSTARSLQHCPQSTDEISFV